ncbi:MAG: 3-oxoacyl-[acyl-carrier-protein] synthase III C-terminal domain-containing protein [Rhodocyclaceae bacterium]
MLNLRLIATGRAEPSVEVSAKAIDEKLNLKPGESLKWSGVESRRFSPPEETQSQLAARALSHAMKNAGLSAGSLDLLIAACGVQEQALPSTACAIGAHAGLPPGTPAFDINASCLSFVMALQLAGSLLNTGTYRRVAVVSADQPSRGVDWEIPEASMIFGDGAAAAIVEKGHGQQGIRSFLYKTYVEGRQYCEIRAGGTRRNPSSGSVPKDYLFSMNGKQLLKLALNVMPGFMRELMDQQGVSQSSVDVVVPHQASHLGMSHMVKRLGLDPKRIVDIYRTHGNQVAASIPTALHHALESGRLGPGKRALLIGTAAGVSIGGMVLDL